MTQPENESATQLAAQIQQWRSQRVPHRPGCFSCLEGKVYVLSGHCSGIGAAISLMLQREGAFVIGLDKAQDQEQGPNLAGLQVDLTSKTDLEKLSQTLQGIKQIDGLINNAGIMPLAPIGDLVLEDLELTLDINVVGAIQLTKIVVPLLQKAHAASIIFMASQLAYTGEAGTVAYTTSKAAILGVTRSLARELGPRIRVNAVAPGPIKTQMTDNFLDGDWERQKSDKLIAKRFGNPDEVASVVRFLLSDNASLVIGQTLSANGGGYLS